MKKILFLLVALIAMSNTTQSYGSDNDDDIVLPLSNQLHGSIKYNINEPRGKQAKDEPNKFLKWFFFPKPKNRDNLLGAKLLSHSIDRIAGLYQEDLHKQTLLSNAFKASTLALQKYSWSLTSLCNYLHNNPAALNSCFSLTLNPFSIAVINSNYRSEVIKVCEINGKKYLTLGAERVKNLEGLEQIIQSSGKIVPEHQRVFNISKDAHNGGLTFSRWRSAPIEQYLVIEAVWRRAVHTKTQHLLNLRFYPTPSFCGLEIHPIDQYILPYNEFSNVDSYDDGFYCLWNICSSYRWAERYIAEMLKILDPGWSCFLWSKEEEDNYHARVSVLRWALEDLTSCHSNYSRMLALLKKTRKQLISQIENVGLRNDACIHDPLYRFITEYLRVPNVEEHRRVNSFKYKFVHNIAIPFLGNVLVPIGKYVLLPLAIGTVVIIFPLGTFALIGFTQLVAGGMTVTAAAITTAAFPTTLILGGTLLAWQSGAL